MQDHIKIDQRWVIMLGGRHDKVKADEADLLSQQSGELYDDSATTGRAGLVYLFDNGFAPYASYSESFQPTSGRDVNDHAFKPTEGQQYELGMRYQPADTDLMLTASVYQLTQTNVITRDLNDPDESVQEGEVESSGFELEAKAKLAHNLNLIASYGYIDNAVTQSNTGTEGNRFGAVPRNAATLWADYDISQVLGFGAGLRYFGDSTNLANTYEVPSFTVVDAVINYRFSPDMDLALNLNNVFDKEYVTCSYACFYGVERSAVATATFRW